MMFNRKNNPADMPAWLRRRNHHIPLEDLDFMLSSALDLSAPGRYI